MKRDNARRYADEVAASIDEENRQLVEYKFQLSMNFEEALKPAKELKAKHALQQENILRLRRQNDDLATSPSEQERLLLSRLEVMREKRKHELGLLENAKAELKAETARAQKLDAKISHLDEQNRARVSEMRKAAEAYEEVLALHIDPSEGGGLKITYVDLRRSFLLRLKTGKAEAEIAGVSGCEDIIAEFNRRLNVGALLYRMRETLKSRHI